MNQYELMPLLAEYRQRGDFAHLATGLMASEDQKAAMMSLEQDELAMFHEAQLGLHRLKFEYFCCLNELWNGIWGEMLRHPLLDRGECTGPEFRYDSTIPISPDEHWDFQHLVRCFEFGSEENWLIAGVEFDRANGEVRAMINLALGWEPVTDSFDLGPDWLPISEDEYCRTRLPLLEAEGDHLAGDASTARRIVTDLLDRISMAQQSAIPA